MERAQKVGYIDLVLGPGDKSLASAPGRSEATVMGRSWGFGEEEEWRPSRFPVFIHPLWLPLGPAPRQRWLDQFLWVRSTHAQGMGYSENTRILPEQMARRRVRNGTNGDVTKDMDQRSRSENKSEIEKSQREMEIVAGVRGVSKYSSAAIGLVFS